ncbi:hypothetical protein BDW62DRAFT_26443 [Aspergillus aurantiobrunneus]
MMVCFGDERRRSWEPSIDAPLSDLPATSSAGPSIEAEVISPLSPISSHEPFPPPGTQGTINRLREDSSSNFMDSISPIKRNEPWNDNFWSDATTATAVLSLLHKEPINSPSESGPMDEPSRRITHITCSVCHEALEPECYPETPIAAGCDHTPMPGTHICTMCLSRSLDIQFSTSQAALLTCPLCHARLSDGEVERWASMPTFLAYDMARTWQMLEEDVEFVMCINPDCGYGQLHAGGPEDPVVVCRACSTRTCFNHRNTPWHEGFTCAEYEAIGCPSMINESCIPEGLRVSGVGNARYEHFGSEEFLSQRTIQETTRACPGCHVATERAGGCKHMQCGMCWSEWCWDCGIRWERGHLDVDCSIFPNEP